MKYTDRERIERIVSTTRKLLDYLEANGITKEDVLNQEPLRWTIITPHYRRHAFCHHYTARKDNKPDWVFMENYMKSLPYGDRI